MKLNEELKKKIFESLGAASMCWSETPKGIFEVTRCKQIGDDLVSALETEEAANTSTSAMVPCPKHRFEWYSRCCPFGARCSEWPCMIEARHQ